MFFSVSNKYTHSAVGTLAICLSVIINLKFLSATKIKKKWKEKRKIHSSPLFWPYSHGRAQIFGWLCYFVEAEVEPHTYAIFLRRRIMYDVAFYVDVQRIAYVTCVRVWPYFFFTLYWDFTQETLLRGGSSFAPAATWLTWPLSSFTPLCYASSLQTVALFSPVTALPNFSYTSSRNHWRQLHIMHMARLTLDMPLVLNIWILTAATTTVIIIITTSMKNNSVNKFEWDKIFSKTCKRIFCVDHIFNSTIGTYC